MSRNQVPQPSRGLIESAARSLLVRIGLMDSSGTASSAPFTDTTALVKGSSDTTKKMRIEVDGITTGNTRVLTMADQNVDLNPNASFLAYNEAASLLSTLTPAADRLPYYTGADASGLATFTAAGRALIDDASASAQVATLGLSTKQLVFKCFAAATNCATGDGADSIYIGSTLNGYNITSVHGQAITAGTTNTMDVQIRRVRGGIGGTAVDVLSTKLTWGSTEAGTDTAATAAVINGSNDDLATGDLLFIDVDAVQTTPAQGMEITLIVTLP